MKGKPTHDVGKQYGNGSSFHTISGAKVGFSQLLPKQRRIEHIPGSAEGRAQKNNQRNEFPAYRFLPRWELELVSWIQATAFHYLMPWILDNLSRIVSISEGHIFGPVV
jgi:hypothetical protein